MPNEVHQLDVEFNDFQHYLEPAITGAYCGIPDNYQTEVPQAHTEMNTSFSSTEQRLSPVKYEEPVVEAKTLSNLSPGPTSAAAAIEELIGQMEPPVVQLIEPVQVFPESVAQTEAKSPVPVPVPVSGTEEPKSHYELSEVKPSGSSEEPIEYASLQLSGKSKLIYPSRLTGSRPRKQGSRVHDFTSEKCGFVTKCPIQAVDTALIETATTGTPISKKLPFSPPANLSLVSSPVPVSELEFTAEREGNHKATAVFSEISPLKAVHDSKETEGHALLSADSAENGVKIAQPLESEVVKVVFEKKKKRRPRMQMMDFPNKEVDPQVQKTNPFLNEFQSEGVCMGSFAGNPAAVCTSGKSEQMPSIEGQISWQLHPEIETKISSTQHDKISADQYRNIEGKVSGKNKKSKKKHMKAQSSKTAYPTVEDASTAQCPHHLKAEIADEVRLNKNSQTQEGGYASEAGFKYGRVKHSLRENKHNTGFLENVPNESQIHTDSVGFAEIRCAFEEVKIQKKENVEGPKLGKSSVKLKEEEEVQLKTEILTSKPADRQEGRLSPKKLVPVEEQPVDIPTKNKLSPQKFVSVEQQHKDSKSKKAEINDKEREGHSLLVEFKIDKRQCDGQTQKDVQQSKTEEQIEVLLSTSKQVDVQTYTDKKVSSTDLIEELLLSDIEKSAVRPKKDECGEQSSILELVDRVIDTMSTEDRVPGEKCASTCPEMEVKLQEAKGKDEFCKWTAEQKDADACKTVAEYTPQDFQVMCDKGHSDFRTLKMEDQDRKRQSEELTTKETDAVIQKDEAHQSAKDIESSSYKLVVTEEVNACTFNEYSLKESKIVANEQKTKTQKNKSKYDKKQKHSAGTPQRGVKTEKNGSLGKMVTRPSDLHWGEELRDYKAEKKTKVEETIFAEMGVQSQKQEADGRERDTSRLDDTELLNILKKDTQFKKLVEGDRENNTSRLDNGTVILEIKKKDTSSKKQETDEEKDASRLADNTLFLKAQKEDMHFQNKEADGEKGASSLDDDSVLIKAQKEDTHSPKEEVDDDKGMSRLDGDTALLKVQKEDIGCENVERPPDVQFDFRSQNKNVSGEKTPELADENLHEALQSKEGREEAKAGSLDEACLTFEAQTVVASDTDSQAETLGSAHVMEVQGKADEGEILMSDGKQNNVDILEEKFGDEGDKTDKLTGLGTGKFYGKDNKAEKLDEHLDKTQAADEKARRPVSNEKDVKVKQDKIGERAKDFKSAAVKEKTLKPVELKGYMRPTKSRGFYSSQQTDSNLNKHEKIKQFEDKRKAHQKQAKPEEKPAEVSAEQDITSPPTKDLPPSPEKKAKPSTATSSAKPSVAKTRPPSTSTPRRPTSSASTLNKKTDSPTPATSSTSTAKRPASTVARPSTLTPKETKPKPTDIKSPVKSPEKRTATTRPAATPRTQSATSPTKASPSASAAPKTAVTPGSAQRTAASTTPRRPTSIKTDAKSADKKSTPAKSPSADSSNEGFILQL
ncbi:nucleoprotein TPR-like [Protopterus annectens]|uniref:nucleoprotein TPR-like n=1 Tax=Protopterus annectens TaxID=7888 RepID=UPI001CFC20F9|nr:nucleoprotein TPR-like [Protopterus annectens]